MTILTLLLYVAFAAALMTGIMMSISGTVKSAAVSFLQNFCGALFVFSGFVKAVDPIGTAIKMQEYFEEFETTAKGSFLHFSADIFPLLAKYAMGFSVFMIVLEILIGILLILGHIPRWSSWLFFMIMVFFTILTGFTFLTAYVPKDANFFEFSKWTVFTESNMRVTSCGCFGDFLKLTPEISFKKDIFLMVPAVIFLFAWRRFHVLGSLSLRNALTLFSTVGLTLFCFANYKWNEPVFDFRPFRIGTDVKAQKQAESKAMSDVKIEKWKLKNKSTGEIKVLLDEEYFKNIKSYPKSEWEVVDQIKSLPAIPVTKISDFALSDLEGGEVTQEILEEPRSRIMVNMPKLAYSSKTLTTTLQDTIWKLDTLIDPKSKVATYQNSILEIKTKTVKSNVYTWNEEYKNLLTSKILPFLDSLKQDSIKCFFVAGGASEDALKSLFGQLNITDPVYTADDVLLKTIMRSNPGIILWRNGKIIMKWHYRRIPDLTEMRRDFLDWKAPPIH